MSIFVCGRECTLVRICKHKRQCLVSIDKVKLPFTAVSLRVMML